MSSTELENSIELERSMCLYHYHTPVHHDYTNTQTHFSSIIPMPCLTHPCSNILRVAAIKLNYSESPTYSQLLHTSSRSAQHCKIVVVSHPFARLPLHQTHGWHR